MWNFFGGFSILALLFMCACICFMFHQITHGFKDAADMREPAIALAARSVKEIIQHNQPFSVTMESKELERLFSVKLFFHDIPSSSERNQITPLVCFLYSQTQSSSKPFSLLLSTLNCDL